MGSTGKKDLSGIVVARCCWAVLLCAGCMEGCVRYNVIAGVEPTCSAEAVLVVPCSMCWLMQGMCLAAGANGYHHIGFVLAPLAQYHRFVAVLVMIVSVTLDYLHVLVFASCTGSTFDSCSLAWSSLLLSPNMPRRRHGAACSATLLFHVLPAHQ